MTAVNVQVWDSGPAAPGTDVAGAVAAHLADIAGQIAGVAPDQGALAAIRRLLGGTLPYPLSDPRYRQNALNPGGLPVEVSFAEAAPRALRVDLAPGSPDLGPVERATGAVALAGIGQAELAPWRRLLSARRFGGFGAAAISPGEPLPGDRLAPWLVRRKAYLELGWDPPAGVGLAGVGLPGPEPRLWESAMAAIPGLRPHFLAVTPGVVSPGQGPGGLRMYFECTGGLALTNLAAWARGLGLEAPALAAAGVVRRLTGGAMVLPAGGLLLAVGCTRVGGPELKVELPAGVLGPDPLAAISAILMTRPRVEAAFTRWCKALGGSPAPTVVSVRVATSQAAPTLNVYTGLAL